MNNKIHYDHLGQPITVRRESNRSLWPEVHSRQARSTGLRPTGVVEKGCVRALRVPVIPIQKPLKWVKRRKLVTVRNPEGVERGPSRMQALPHNLVKRPLGRRPKRT